MTPTPAFGHPPGGQLLIGAWQVPFAHVSLVGQQ